MMADGETAVGVLAGRFVPGALRVDASEFAKLHEEVPRGVQTLRLSDVDETEATLAWDAVSAVLRDEKFEPKDLGGLVVSSWDAEDTAGLLANVLARDELEVQTAGGARESAAGALVQAFGLARKKKGPVLFVAAQDTTWSVQRAEGGGGLAAGAVALLLGPGAPVVWQGHKTIHHLAEAGPVEKSLQVLQEGQGASEKIVAVAASTPTDQKRWQKGAGDLRMSASLLEQVGDLGPVAPAVSLLVGMEDSAVGGDVAVVVPGAHRSMMLFMRVEETPRVSSVKRSLESGVQIDPVAAGRIRRAWVESQTAEPRGAYVPLSVFHSQDPARLRLVGQKCTECGRLLFPPRERCPHCGGADLEEHVLSGTGAVHSWTRIQKGGAPSEFAPLQRARGAYAVSVVELAQGPRVAAMLTGPGLDGSGVEIGSRVRLVPRLVYVQEGVPRYSFKALLAPEEEAPEGEG